MMNIMEKKTELLESQSHLFIYIYIYKLCGTFPSSFLLLIPSRAIFPDFRRWIQAVFRFSDSSNYSVSKESAIKEALCQENVKSNVKESTSQYPSNNFEIDMSEGVAAEMFGISPSNDNEVCSTYFLLFLVLSNC
jgi:hypothetical protein